MSLLQLYRDDLLNRFADHAFTETTVGSMTLVDFEHQDTIDSVSDSGGTARFTYASGPTIAVDQIVRVYGFTTNTAYNQTGAVSATNGTTYFEISGVSFGTTETGSLGALIFSTKKLVDTDAYKNIHHNLVGTFSEALPRLTTTQRDALTGPDDGLQFFETTVDEVQVTYQGVFETVGGGEWKTRSATTVQTTDATETTVDSFTLDDEETYLVQSIVVATQSDGSARGGFINTATIYRDGGGSATIQGGVTTNHQGTTAPWDATITVSSNDVRASVSGAAATTINWKCTMQFIEQ